MEFEIIFKMVKICIFVVLTIVEILSGDKPDKPDF